jgi:hypothetical protein
MAPERYELFFYAALEKTKKGNITWQRGDPQALPYTNPDDIFKGTHEKGSIVIARDYAGELSCWIQPDPDMPLQPYGEPNDPALYRLYRYVRTLLPSAKTETFIDMVIRDYDFNIPE